jgi:hypothetical protein
MMSPINIELLRDQQIIQVTAAWAREGADEHLAAGGGVRVLAKTDNQRATLLVIAHLIACKSQRVNPGNSVSTDRRTTSAIM